jgi:hypothetical protein
MALICRRVFSVLNLILENISEETTLIVGNTVQTKETWGDVLLHFSHLIMLDASKIDVSRIKHRNCLSFL